MKGGGGEGGGGEGRRVLVRKDCRTSLFAVAMGVCVWPVKSVAALPPCVCVAVSQLRRGMSAVTKAPTMKVPFPRRICEYRAR